MKCTECKEINQWSKPDRPYCDECDIKKRTCTVCGEVIEYTSVMISVRDGKEIGRGHNECLNDAKL